MEFEEWALQAAGEVVAHVERHGLTCTWSDAHERLRTHAGKGLLHLLFPVEENDVTDGDEDVALYLAGKIQLDQPVSKEISLDEVTEGYAALSDPAVSRVVITRPSNAYPGRPGGRWRTRHSRVAMGPSRRTVSL